MTGSSTATATVFLSTRNSPTRPCHQSLVCADALASTRTRTQAGTLRRSQATAWPRRTRRQEQRPRALARTPDRPRQACRGSQTCPTCASPPEPPCRFVSKRQVCKQRVRTRQVRTRQTKSGTGLPGAGAGATSDTYKLPFGLSAASSSALSDVAAAGTAIARGAPALFPGGSAATSTGAGGAATATGYALGRSYAAYLIALGASSASQPRANARAFMSAGCFRAGDRRPK